MTISPLNNKYATKDYVDDGFAGISKQIDSIETNMSVGFKDAKDYMRDGFGKLTEQIDAVETNLDRKLGVMDKKIDAMNITLNKIAEKVLID